MIDLFEHYQELPEPVLAIIESFDEDADPYHECMRLERTLEPLGYTFEWGLDGIPFNLTKSEGVK